MITRMFDAIKEILRRLDVGGGVKTFKSVIDCPWPPKDILDEIEKRRLLVRKLRLLAVEAKGLTAFLPTLPVENWFDGTVEDATKDVYFENYDLAKLLQFIADVGVSYED